MANLEIDWIWESVALEETTPLKFSKIEFNSWEIALNGLLRWISVTSWKFGYHSSIPMMPM
jgi:hypothetical protein